MELTGNRYMGNDWRRLLSTRRGTVVVAAVCTLVAAGVLVYAASRYRQSVDSSGGVRTVLVAGATIVKGTSGDTIASQQLFHAQSVAAKQVSAGAIADTALLHGKVAAADISPGQQLTLGDFTSGGGYVSQLAPDERVISVPLDASHGLAGVAQAGDRVDVYADWNFDVNGSGGGNASGGALRLLVPNVPVLAVGQNSGSGGLGGGGATSQQADVVLKVKASDAGAVALASDFGKIWLVLRGSNAAEPNTQARGTYNVQTLLRSSTSIAGVKG
jgi:Flp pilus assembly protein CpaB